MIRKQSWKVHHVIGRITGKCTKMVTGSLIGLRDRAEPGIREVREREVDPDNFSLHRYRTLISDTE